MGPARGGGRAGGRRPPPRRRRADPRRRAGWTVAPRCPRDGEPAGGARAAHLSRPPHAARRPGGRDMRLTLVDNLVLPHERDLQLLDTHPHLGLLSLGAVAGAAGHETTIYDPKRLIRSGALPYDEHLYERVAAALLADGPDSVGFTTLGCSFLFVLGVGRELARTAPDLPLLLGGPHATMLARPILERYDPFDVVVRHEAERTLPGV